jgi:hypothetical protein
MFMTWVGRFVPFASVKVSRAVGPVTVARSEMRKVGFAGSLAEKLSDLKGRPHRDALAWRW